MNILMTIVLSIIILAFIYLIIKNKNNRLFDNLFNKNNLLFSIPLFISCFVLYLHASKVQGLEPKGVTVIECITAASLKAFTFSIDRNLCEAICLTDKYFEALLIINISLCGLTLISSIIVVVKAFFGNLIRINAVKKNDFDLVVGYNDETFEYLTNNPKTILFIDTKLHNLNKEEKQILHKKGIPYILKEFNFKNVCSIKTNKKFNLIYLEDVENISKLYDFSNEAVKSNKSIDIYSLNENIHTPFINNVLNRITSDSHNVSSFCLNKHELLCRDFSLKYNLAKFLPRSFIENATIKSDKEIVVNIIGAGKMGKAMLKALIMNNQFVSLVNGSYVPYKVKYRLFDESNKCLEDEIISLLTNFDSCVQTKTNEKPDPLCDFEFIQTHLNLTLDNFDFKYSPDVFNYYFLCLNSSVNNCSFAEAINELADNRNSMIFYNVDNVEQGFEKDSNTIPFGFKSEFYKHDVIINDELGLLAESTNKAYKEYRDMGDEVDFKKLPFIQKMSNYYADINVEFKLNLLGLHMTKDNCHSLTKEDFDKIYVPINEKTEDDFFKISVANALAVTEKLRWNAFELLNGFRPMELTDFYYVYDEQKKKGKVYHKREANKKHGCITTYKGLQKVHQQIVKVYKENGVNKSIMDIQTYSYDCTKMNQLFENLKIFGWKITELTTKE